MRFGRAVAAVMIFALVVGAMPRGASADEGGASFWLPGQIGSFAALPGTPGWSLPTVFYYQNANAGADKTYSLGGNITTGVDASAPVGFLFPTYTLRDPQLGGQAAISLGWGLGQMDIAVDATLTGPAGTVLQRNVSDRTTGGSDLYPQATLKWNKGTSNYMVYALGGVPVGAYEAGRLANLGLNHWSLDGGGGYTYLDSQKGRELSAALGFTYNFENPATHYRNGVDAHFDWALSQFLSKNLHAGMVGYFYNQLSGDGGDGAVLGDFKSRATGLGGEVGRFFVVGVNTWYGQAKAYWDVDSENRPQGWSLWFSLVIQLSAPKS